MSSDCLDTLTARQIASAAEGKLHTALGGTLVAVLARGSAFAARAARAVLVVIAAALAAIAPSRGAPASAVAEAAVRAHASGIWSLSPAGSLRRWVVIHGARDAGILHLEVLGLAPGAPPWQAQRLVDHMAVTLPALLASIERPLERGAVYPERFEEALRRWQAESAAGHGEVCATTVDRCLAGEWR